MGYHLEPWNVIQKTIEILDSQKTNPKLDYQNNTNPNPQYQQKTNMECHERLIKSWNTRSLIQNWIVPQKINGKLGTSCNRSIKSQNTRKLLQSQTTKIPIQNWSVNGKHGISCRRLLEGWNTTRLIQSRKINRTHKMSCGGPMELWNARRLIQSQSVPWKIKIQSKSGNIWNRWKTNEIIKHYKIINPNLECQIINPKLEYSMEAQ